MVAKECHVLGLIQNARLLLGHFNNTYVRSTRFIDGMLHGASECPVTKSRVVEPLFCQGSDGSILLYWRRVFTMGKRYNYTHVRANPSAT